MSYDINVQGGVLLTQLQLDLERYCYCLSLKIVDKALLHVRERKKDNYTEQRPSHEKWSTIRSATLPQKMLE